MTGVLEPLGLSLRVATIAVLLSCLIGVPLAWLLARFPFRGRDLVSVVILIPMVLPPTVLGYYLLLIIGRSGPIGRLSEALGMGRLVFTPTAAVIAASVASFPFLVRTAQAGFEQVDRVYEEAARTLGRGELRIFFTVAVPLAWRGIVAGIALSFARAMGEFGATLMVAGNIPGDTRTASVAIYDAVQAFRLNDAHILSLALSVVSGLILLAITRVGRGSGW
ncbi:MAG: molybdate ABC transporter permease subunit [Gemmatimonadota bacterium]|jgi:molybdate transport system permease protein|nr:molybdate ABC transporter permease subunit [Gemmatimonadota bacterium]